LIAFFAGGKAITRIIITMAERTETPMMIFILALALAKAEAEKTRLLWSLAQAFL
jgi:hypothetical protein